MGNCLEHITGSRWLEQVANLALQHFPSPEERAGAEHVVADSDPVFQNIGELKLDLATELAELEKIILNPAISKTDRVFAFRGYEASEIFYKQVCMAELYGKIKRRALQVNSATGESTDLAQELQVNADTSVADMSALINRVSSEHITPARVCDEEIIRRCEAFVSERMTRAEAVQPQTQQVPRHKADREGAMTRRVAVVVT